MEDISIHVLGETYIDNFWSYDFLKQRLLNYDRLEMNESVIIALIKVIPLSLNPSVALYCLVHTVQTLCHNISEFNLSNHNFHP